MRSSRSCIKPRLLMQRRCVVFQCVSERRTEMVLLCRPSRRKNARHLSPMRRRGWPQSTSFWARLLRSITSKSWVLMAFGWILQGLLKAMKDTKGVVSFRAVLKKELDVYALDLREEWACD